MQLEWRALRRAIESTGSNRAGAESPMRWPSGANAAPAFPERRRANGAEEIREGLASYTGIAALRPTRRRTPRRAAAAARRRRRRIAAGPRREFRSRVRARATGVLLDDLLPGWRRRVRATSDLGDLLASAINRPPTTDVAAAAARYDGATLRTAEEARDRAQQVRVARAAPALRRWAGPDDARRRPRDQRHPPASVGVPECQVPCYCPQPHAVPVSGAASSASGGVLRAADGSTLSVPVTGAARRNHPARRRLERPHCWNAGWLVQPAARPGSFAIAREK